MNNPLTFMQALRNPRAFMQNVAQNSQFMQNPMARNAMEMFQKGDSKGLQEMAENLCKERNTSIEEIQNLIMQKMGTK